MTADELIAIRKLIEKRKVAALKNIFNDERQAMQISMLMYYYDRKGRRYATKPEILFHDNEYLVVRALRGYNTKGSPYHAVWVIGIEDNQPWIHRLPWRRVFEEKDWKPTKEEIKEIMGFDKTAERNKTTLEIKKGETIRLQGDLAIRMQNTLEDALEREVTSKKSLAVGWSLRLEKIEEEAAKITEEEIREAQKKLGYKRLTKKRRKEITQMLARERADKWIEENILSKIDTDKVKRETYEKWTKETKQCNLILGNHVIIIEKGVRESELSSIAPDNRVIVPEETTLHLLHNEHGGGKLRILPGIYRFELLRRHVTDIR